MGYLGINIVSWIYRKHITLRNQGSKYHIFLSNLTFNLPSLCVAYSGLNLFYLIDNLTPSWRRSLSYRTSSIDLHRKLMDWFLYDSDHWHERVTNRYWKTSYWGSSNKSLIGVQATSCWKNKHMSTPSFYSNIKGKVFKSGPSKICRRQPLKNFKVYGLLSRLYILKLFKDCLPQSLLSSLLNTLSYKFLFSQ